MILSRGNAAFCAQVLAPAGRRDLGSATIFLQAVLLKIPPMPSYAVSKSARKSVLSRDHQPYGGMAARKGKDKSACMRSTEKQICYYSSLGSGWPLGPKGFTLFSLQHHFPRRWLQLLLCGWLRTFSVPPGLARTRTAVGRLLAASLGNARELLVQGMPGRFQGWLCALGELPASPSLPGLLCHQGRVGKQHRCRRRCWCCPDSSWRAQQPAVVWSELQVVSNAFVKKSKACFLQMFVF